jgi:ABC-type glycerol-3-phosphate transport system substrate-binding protein
MKRTMKSLMTVLLLLCVISAVYSGGSQATKPAAPSKTIKMVGGGEILAMGPKPTIDAITGLELPGYQVVLDEWKRLHPDTEAVIEAFPWDNWTASIQTAAMSGSLDVILHGASLTDLAVALDDYIAKDPAWASKRMVYSVRRAAALGTLEKNYTTGIPYVVMPELVLINKDLLAHYNIKAPTTDWVWDDLLAIARACTGTDPVTKEKTYGLQFLASNSNGQIWKNFMAVCWGLGLDPIINYGQTAKDCKVNYTDANAMKAWNFIAELAKYTSPADREGIDVSNPSVDLNIAIYFTEQAMLIHNQLKSAGVLDKYYVLNLPRVNAGPLKGAATPYLGDNNYAIFKGSNQKDLAWEWIEFATTNEVCLKYYTDAGGIVNHRDYFRNLDKYIARDWVTAIGYALEKIPADYSPSTGPFVNNMTFGTLQTAVGSGIRTLLMGTGTARDAAASVQKFVDDFMASVK